MHVEKELRELRERLTQVETWKARKEEIEKELAQVWVESGDSLAPPAYVAKEEEEEEEDAKVEGADEQPKEEVDATA